MYRLFVAILFILMFSDPSWAGPLDQADRMFAAKKFQEGVRVLKKAVAKRDLAHEKRFEAGLELAGFYAQKVGDYPRAVSLGRKLIGNRKIIVDPSLASRAQTVLDQWLEQEKIWKDLNRDLRMMKAKTFQRKLLTDPSRAQELDRNGNRLKSILRDHPDFYRTHEVYYVLGLTRLIQDRPFRAWKAFARALELKPAMDLSQPVSKMIKDSASLWQKRFLRILACSVLGILMLVLCAAWIRSRPFQWFRARHLGGGTAVILLWVLVFHLSVNQSRDLENAKDLINSDGIYPVPVYIHLEKGAPGSGPLDFLFYYGLGAVIGAFLFAAATGRVQSRRKVLGLNFAFSVGLSTSLAVLFFLNHCDIDADLYPRELRVSDLSKASLAYPVSDPEPYLVTNPLYYRGLDLNQIDDPELIKWLESFNRFNIRTEE